MNSTDVIKRGNVFFADFAQKVGSEICGTRPVLVLQNDIGNQHSPTIIVAGISSQMKKMYLPTHIQIDEECGLKRKSVVQLEQIHTIDRKRLRGYIGMLSGKMMSRVNQAIQISLGMESSNTTGGV